MVKNVLLIRLCCIEGSLPADPNPIRVYDKPVTILWDIPKSENKAKLESSGNAVLDSLRQQLLSHGAAGTF